MSNIICSNLFFSWPDGTAIVSNNSVSFGIGRTALIGNNGSGKSTFLKLIAGELKPTSGTVVVDGEFAYLTQHITYTASDSIAQLLGIDAIINAIETIDAGVADVKVLDIISDNWDIEERSIAELKRLHLPQQLFSGESILQRTVAELSGGEAMRIALAGILLRRPHIALLDEPTNNLDAGARGWLYESIQKWPGTLLVVSHDRELLEMMDNIAELKDGVVHLYGGAYSHYLETRGREHEAAMRTVRDAKAKLLREKRQQAAGQSKSSASAHHGRVQTARSRFPKAVINLRRSHAQAVAGNRRAERDSRIEESTEKLRKAKAVARTDDIVSIPVPEIVLPSGRTVLEMTIRSKLFCVSGPERIVITGRNGSGKTSLLRTLVQQAHFPELQVKSIIKNVGYLPQNLRLFQGECNSMENIRSLVPNIGINRAHAVLANFLLKGDRLKIPVDSLSGGERLRLALACLFASTPPPELLLLDEPTNNLDIASMSELASALNSYHGAFIIVCHDRHFLDSIKVTRQWLLEGMRFQRDDFIVNIS